MTNKTGLIKKHSVLGVNFIVANKTEAASYILNHIDMLRGTYVCFSNVHTTVMAYDDPSYRDVLNGSAYTFPDGSPIARKIRRDGIKEAERVAGPDFMDELFRLSANTDLRHYFYGSSEDTITKLKTELEQNYPGIKIAGMYSPPFRPLTEGEDRQIVKMINDSHPDFVWIGLGAPKQEKWMANHKDMIDGLMLGVGAGFDFHAGTVKRAPVLMQNMGLEWLYRLSQDPKRLFKRYLVTNTKFIWHTMVRGE